MIDDRRARVLYYQDRFPSALVLSKIIMPALGNNVQLLSQLDLTLDLPDKFHDDKVIVVRGLNFTTPEQLKTILANMAPLAAGLGELKPAPGDCLTLVQEPRYAPLGKLFVLDIDINELPRPCGCGEDKKICAHCWSAVGQQIARMLVWACETRFGVTPLLCFTGRRGLQAYVPTPIFTFAAKEARELALNLLQNTIIVSGGEIFDRHVTTSWDHAASLAFTCKSSGFINRPITPETPFEELFISTHALAMRDPIALRRFNDARQILENYRV